MIIRNETVTRNFNPSCPYCGMSNMTTCIELKPRSYGQSELAGCDDCDKEFAVQIKFSMTVKSKKIEGEKDEVM